MLVSELHGPKFHTWLVTQEAVGADIIIGLRTVVQQRLYNMTSLT